MAVGGPLPCSVDQQPIGACSLSPVDLAGGSLSPGGLAGGSIAPGGLTGGSSTGGLLGSQDPLENMEQQKMVKYYNLIIVRIIFLCVK